MKFNAEPLLYSTIFTIPLGYYVPWLEWFTVASVFVTTALWVIGALAILFNIDKVKQEYKEKGIDSKPKFRLWRAGITLLSLTIMYAFGYTLALWLNATAWIVAWLAIKEITSD